MPDIAVFGDQVSVVYIHDAYGIDKDVNIMQDNLNAVIMGGVSPYFSPSHQYMSPSANDDVGAPRIAGPVLGMALDDQDFQAVVQVNNNIIGINRYAVYSPNITTEILNAANGFNHCDAREPVVAYLYDKIIVAWNQKHCVPVGGKDTKEIFARQLTFGGEPNPYGYSVVNFNRTLAYYEAALDGRYQNMEAFYTFATSASNQILYKSSYFTNNNLRIAPASTDKASLNVYPNPTSGRATVQVTLSSDETAYSLEVYNLTGQRVANLNVAGLKAGVNELHWNSEGKELPAGLYTLKLTTSKAALALKVRKN